MRLESEPMYPFLYPFRAARRITFVSFIASGALLLPLQAQTTDPQSNEIAASAPIQLHPVIGHGRAADLTGAAHAASQGSVGYVELGARPFLRRGELLEVIPG